MSQLITLDGIRSIMDSLLKEGAIVAAPVNEGENKLFFEKIDTSQKAVLSGTVKTVNSIKEFFFPRHEVLCTFKRNGNDIELTDSQPFDREQIIFGARPCDAAALPVLDPLFAWDYQDRFYQSRREKTTVVVFACQNSDQHCFCGALGLAPDDPSGADAMLFDLGNGFFEVRTFTEKGERLFKEKTSSSDQTGKACPVPGKKLRTKELSVWLKKNFTASIWDDMSKRCVGCGACTYLCPTCHCFDIVDEGSFQKGVRVKNWDSCQMANFTLHASGHNPRAVQGQRQRQRIEHKFSIYPEKFGVLLCTGCGNCTRNCPSSLGVRPFLDAIEKQLDQ
ncbi:MAG: 4Fe-4S dicluster domain-containing protein [Planctomycetia bacterium]|nr:4Fe-4S dicluster domain-containing protein [Planctomycetia bacterium]